MTTNTNTLSTESAFSTTYPVRYASASSGPIQTQRKAPKASPREIQTPVQRSASRVLGSCGRFWRTPRSRASIPATTAAKMAHPRSTSGSPGGRVASARRCAAGGLRIRPGEKRAQTPDRTLAHLHHPLPQIARPGEVRAEERQADDDEGDPRSRQDEKRDPGDEQDRAGRNREHLAGVSGQPFHDRMEVRPMS